MQHPKAAPTAEHLSIFQTLGYVPHGGHFNPSRIDSFLGGLTLLVFGTVLQAAAAGVVLAKGSFRLVGILFIMLLQLAMAVFRLQFDLAGRILIALVPTFVGLFAGAAVLSFKVGLSILLWPSNALTFLYMGLRGNVHRIVDVTTMEVGGDPRL